MSNIGQGSNESTLDQEAALNKKQKKTVSQGVKGSVTAQAGVVSPESAIAVKKLRRKPVADDTLPGDNLGDSASVVSDVDASALNDGGTWQLAQAETGSVLPALGGAASGSGGAAAGAAAASGAGAAAAGVAGAGAAMGAGAAAAAGLGLGTVAAVAAGATGLAVAAGGGKTSSPAPAAPPAPTISVVSGDDRVNNSENTTGVTISGATVAGATVKIYDGETLLGTVTADGSGGYSLANVHFATSAGATHNITATATTSTGESARTAIHAVQVDTVAPTGISGAISHNGTYDTGASASDNLTNNTRPQIEGNVEANASVSVAVGGQTLTATADGTGHYVVTPATLAAGAYTPVVTVTDAAGNSTTVNGTAFTVDTTGPATPTGSISHDAVNDSGNSATDNITANATPLIVGTAEAGASVRVVVGAQTLTTTADINGNFSVTPTALATGAYTPVITVTDTAGNSTTANGTAFTVGVALAAPTINTVAGNDAVNATENAATIAVSGTAAANSTVKVYDGANLLGTTTADGAGHYSLSLSAGTFSASAGATHNLTATATNNVGTSAPSAIHAVLVDTVAPSPASAAITHNSTYDTGASTSDSITSNSRPQIEGYAEANASVSIVVGGQTLTATADSNGHFAVRPSSALSDNTYTPVITVTDAAGNTVTGNGTAFTISSAAPLAATGVSIRHDVANDTGFSATDSITNDTTPAIIGTTTAGAAVTVVVAGQTLTTTADSSGHFSVTPTALAAGTYTPVVTVTDAAGNGPVTVNGTAFTVDLTNSIAPSASLAHTNSNDAGISHADSLTNAAAPVISGTAEANAHITVVVAGQTLTTVADNSGNFSVTAAPMVSGTYTPVITSTDAAGNSNTNNGDPFTIDTIRPGAAVGHLDHTLVSDTGASQDDNITGNVTPVIVISAEPGATVTVDVGGQTYTATESVPGTFKVTTNELDSGEHVPVITVTDAAGNSTTSMGVAFTVEASPAPSTVNPLTTNSTLEHPTAILRGHADIDSCAEGGVVVVFEGQTYTQADLNLVVDDSGNWLLDVGDQVRNQNIGDGHYDVTVVATNLAGMVTTSVLTDALWLVNGCQEFAAGTLSDDNHWNITGEPGAETLGVDFGVYVTSLGGIEVADFVVSEFNFDAEDVTLAECGIDVTHANATVLSNNITLDGSNVSAVDTLHVSNGNDQTLNAGITLSASGSIKLLGYGDTGMTGPLDLPSGNGGLVTLSESLAPQAGYHFQPVNNLFASDAGIYLTADNYISIYVDGHTTAGVTLSQTDIGFGEDWYRNVQLSNAHIGLEANGGIYLYSSYADVTESGTYTLVDHGITRFETAQSTVYGTSALDVDLLQDHVSAENFLDVSNASITLGAQNVGVGSVLIAQNDLHGGSVDLSSAHIDVFGMGVSLMDSIETSYSDITLQNAFESHDSSYWGSGNVEIVQHNVVADGSIDAYDAQISVGAMGLGVGDVGVVQFDMHAAGGIDMSGAQATVGSGYRWDVGTVSVSTDYTYYDDYSANIVTRSGNGTFSASDVYVVQYDVTAGDGDVNAASASAVLYADYSGSFIAPLQSSVYVEQDNITALGGSVDLSGANASESIGAQSYWYGYSDNFGAYNYLTSDYTSAHDYTVFSVSSSDTYDRTASEFSAWGSEVAVDQYDIRAGYGAINAEGAFAGLALEYVSYGPPVVFGGDVSISQTYLVANGPEGGVNLNSAHASLYSQENFELVAHTATADVSVHEYYVETVGGVFSQQTTRTDDYTFYSDTVDFGSVHVDQFEIHANGNINAVDAAVSIDVDGLLSGDLYISQDNIRAVDGNVDLQGAHIAVQAQGDITLVNSIVSIWEHTYDSSTTFGGSSDSHDTVLQDYYDWNQGSAYLEQRNVTALGGSVNISDASVVINAGSLTAYDVLVNQEHVSAVAGDVDIAGATVGVTVGYQGDIKLAHDAFVTQDLISAYNGDLNASGANVALVAGFEGYVTADEVFVSQIHITASGNVDITDAGVVINAGDGAEVDLPYAAFVRQTYISAGGHLNASGAQVEVTVGSDTSIDSGIYTDYAVIQQDHLTADAWMNIDGATVNLVAGDFAVVSIGGSAFISQDYNTAGSSSELYGALAGVSLSAGNQGLVTADAAYIEQNHLYGGSVDISAASVEVSVGDSAQIRLNANAYVSQNFIIAHDGDVSATSANVTLAAGDDSYISVDNVLVYQNEITASGDIDIWQARAVVDAGAGAYVEVSGDAFVLQGVITAGGYLDASNAQVHVAVGDGTTNDNASIYTDGAYISQAHLHAGDWMSLDSANVNILGGDGAFLYVDGSAYISQWDNTAGDNNVLSASNASVSLLAGESASVTANAVFVDQHSLTGGSVEFSDASALVTAGGDSEVMLSGGVFVNQRWIDAGNGDLIASGASAALAVGADSDVSADAVYVYQRDLGASGDLDISEAQAAATGGDGANVDVPSGVYVQQRAIYAGGHLDASGAQVTVGVGSDSSDNGAHLYTDYAYVLQRDIAGDSVDLSDASVDVRGGNYAFVDVGYSAYISQHHVTAEGFGGELYAAGAQVTAAAGYGSDVSANSVFIEQVYLTGGSVDVSAARVEVSVGDDFSTIGMEGNVFIDQSWILARDGHISANDVSVLVSGGEDSYISIDNVFVTQSEITASGLIAMWNVEAAVSAGDGAYVDVPGAVYVEQNNISAGWFALDMSGAQARIAVGSDSWYNNGQASIYTDGVYVSQDHITNDGWVDADWALADVQAGNGAVIEIDGAAYVSQSEITANNYVSSWGGLWDANVGVNVGAGSNSVITADEAFVEQHNLTGHWVDMHSAHVDVNVGDGGEITLDTGAYVDQEHIVANDSYDNMSYHISASGFISATAVGVSLTGGYDALITIDGSVYNNGYDDSWNEYPGDGGVTHLRTFGFYTYFGGAEVAISQVDMYATENVDLSQAHILVSVDHLQEAIVNTPPVSGHSDISLDGTPIAIVQGLIDANGGDVNLNSAQVDVLAGFDSTIAMSGQSSAWSSAHYSSYVGPVNLHVFHADEYLSHSEYNRVAVDQYIVTADQSVYADDARVVIAAGDEASVTLDATSVFVDQGSIRAYGGDVHATNASLLLQVGNASELRLTSAEDWNTLYVSDYGWDRYDKPGTGDFITQWDTLTHTYANTYSGAVAVDQVYLTADYAVDISGANIQLAEGSASNINVTGMDVYISQSDVTAHYGNVNANAAVIDMSAENGSGIYFTAAQTANDFYTTAHYWAEDVGYAWQSWWYRTDNHITGDQYFSIAVEQHSLTAFDGDVNANGSAITMQVGDDSSIVLHGGNVYISQSGLYADGGNVNLNEVNIDLAGGSNSHIQIEQGMQTVTHEYWDSYSWNGAPANTNHTRTVTGSTFAGDVYIDQLNVYAQEILSGSGYGITSGGDVNMNDVSLHMSVGDADYLSHGWISAHNVVVNQSSIDADENLSATAVGLNLEAGINAYIEIHNADVFQTDMVAGHTLHSKMVGDYFNGFLVDDNHNTDLAVDFWGTMDLSGTSVHLSAGADVRANEAIIVQAGLTAGESVDLSSATVGVTSGGDIDLGYAVIAQSNVTAGGQQWYYNTTGISGYSRWQIEDLGTLTAVPQHAVANTIVGLVDMSNDAVNIDCGWNLRGDVVAMERNDIVAGEMINMYQNSIDVNARDIALGDVHNWVGVGGYDSGHYDATLSGVSAATFNFNDSSIQLQAWNGDISVDHYVEQYRFVTAAVISADGNTVGLTAADDISVGYSVGIGNDVVAGNYEVPVQVAMSNNEVNISAGGSAYLSDVYIGIQSDGYSNVDLTMNDNNIYISGHNVYASDIWNVEVNIDPASLTGGSSVDGNSLEIYANEYNGHIELNSVSLFGTDASADIWGNHVTIDSLGVQYISQSHITIGAEHLDMTAGSDLTVDLIDLTKQGVLGLVNPPPTNTNWWYADAYISSDSVLNLTNVKLDGAQAFLAFEADSGSTIHYDITLDQLGIAENNGSHTNTEQFDLIDLSGLGITDVNQLDWSVTLGDSFSIGIVEKIHFSLHSTNGTGLGAGSTVEFDLNNVRLDSSARYDYYAVNGHQGANGPVDATDVWYAFWNSSLHLAP